MKEIEKSYQKNFTKIIEQKWDSLLSLSKREPEPKLKPSEFKRPSVEREN